MGPGLRQDDIEFVGALRPGCCAGCYRLSTAIGPVRKRQPLAITDTKYVSSLWLSAGSRSDRVELVRVQHVEQRCRLGWMVAAAAGFATPGHLADRGLAAEAAHARGAIVLGRDHDAEATVEDEVLGIVRIAGLHDDSPASTSRRWQRRSARRHRAPLSRMPGPVAQARFFLRQPLMLRDELVLAPLQRTIELGMRATPSLMKSLERSNFSPRPTDAPG